MLRKIKKWIKSVNVVEAIAWGGLALFLCISVATAYAHPTDQNLRRAIAAPVHQMQEPGISCSVVMVAPERALTAAHCLRMQEPTVEINGALYPVEVGYQLGNEDLALLIIPSAPCPCANYAETFPVDGDWLAAVGFPFGLHKVVTYGEMQGYIVYEDGMQYILTTTLGAPGNSGGGLFNEHGDLVGITVMGAQGHSMFAVWIDPNKTYPLGAARVFGPKTQ